jgi:hypothetical protein
VICYRRRDAAQLRTLPRQRPNRPCAASREHSRRRGRAVGEGVVHLGDRSRRIPRAGVSFDKRANRANARSILQVASSAELFSMTNSRRGSESTTSWSTARRRYAEMVRRIPARRDIINGAVNLGRANMRAVRSYAQDCSCASGNVEFREDLHDDIGCATIRFEQPSVNSHIE